MRSPQVFFIYSFCWVQSLGVMQHIRLLFFLSQFFLVVLIASLSVQAQYQYQWQAGSRGTGEAQFNGSFGHGVAVDGAGAVYVADGENHRIQKLNNTGRFLSAFGSYGTENGQFNTPVEVSVDGAGNVYVVEWNNHRVQKFDSSGQFVTTFGRSGTTDERLNYPTGVAVDAEGNVYVTDGDNNDRVLKFNASGQCLLKFGSRGTGDGQFNAPSAIAIDGAGNIYVSDQTNNRVQKFNGNGQFISAFGGSGRGDGQFDHPNGIAIDGADNIYVSEWNNNRIQKFNSSGQFLLKLDGAGAGNGQFNRPDGVAADDSGNVYVYDALNYRVQKFSPVPCSSSPLTPGTLPEGTAGATYSVTVGGAPAGYTYSATGLPDGLSMSSAGVISGTPATAADAPASVTITAGFYHCSQTAKYLLKINKPTATVSISNTRHTYSGRAHSVAVTTIPTGLPVGITYNGATVLPGDAGSYTVVATVTSPDYVGSASATLTIDKAPLLVTADDLSRAYGNPDPPLTLAYTGFVNGETHGVIDTLPSVSTTATQSSKAGTYPIVLAGGSDNNYDLTLQNGTMAVTALSQAITFMALPAKTFGDAPFPLSASATSGLAVTFSSSNPAVATLSGNTVTITGAGTVTLTASQSGDDIYGAATRVSQTLLVAKAGQEISFAAFAEKRETDAPFRLSATASSGLPVSFEVVSGPATVSGNS
ncbi:MAG: hypothetical protein ICV83_14875, partial [Cytophagales bacterium]|nr:hypothetical protein [Cytophagales bacterium]